MFLRVISFSLAAAALQAQAPYAGMEARLCHPLDLTPDGTRLLAVHGEAASLSVFDTTSAGPAPVRLAEIPVGLEPVTVRARTHDEAWVVCELSDSIHIVSLSAGATVAVLRTGDEPADVVFAGGKAFVTCARDNEIRVYDAVTRAQLAQIPVQGAYPTALAVSADGSRVFASFLHSGNGTTILKKEDAPQQPAPSNPALPPAPRTGLIVPASDPRIPYTVLDHDVVEIDTASHQVVGYLGGVGTNLMALSPRPGHEELWAANTEALNLIQFEPALNGRFALNRLSAIDLTSGQVTAHDLNPGVDYNLLDNPPARAVALSQPMALVFEPDGAALWTAAFASDRVARVDAATGQVLARVDVRPDGAGSGEMRGPRGLALHTASGRLYVLNKLRESISVIDLNDAAPEVIAEADLSSHDPLPPEVKHGRGFLFDARLSGNGTVSCGICHIDADRDGLAWDLGDPAGELLTVIGQNLSIHDLTPRPRVMHPMKGPMTTQTLRGMQDGAPFHWRGDRATIADFNPTYRDLMGGEPISDEEMEALTAYLMTLRHHPNPNRNLDRSLPASFDGGNPVRGRDMFNDHLKSHCTTCHTLPTGSDNNIDLPQESGLSQPVKNPPLRTIYQRLFHDPRSGGVSLNGFGLLHDGVGGGVDLPIVHPYVLDDLRTVQELRDVSAFMLCFDTGTGLLVGRENLLNHANQNDPSVLAALDLQETRTRASFPDCDLVARGLWGGEPRAFLYDRASQRWRADRAADGLLSRAQLLGGLQPGDTLLVMGVLPGQGERLGGDLDGDGVLDGDDPDNRQYNGSPRITQEPADRAVAPGGTLTLSVTALGEPLQYRWFRNNQPLNDQTQRQLQRSGVTTADAGTYHVVVQNGLGEVTSRSAKVEVFPAPVITAQPSDRVVDQDKNATLSVTASGSNLAYQWHRGGQPVIGANRRTLSFPRAQALDAGVYSVTVSNGAGSVTSAPATLTVIIPPVVEPQPVTAGTVGQPYHFPLVALNGPTQFTVTGLPRGLSVRGMAITGVPLVEGDFPLRVSARNSAGSSGAAVTMNLRVQPFPPGAIGVFEGVVPRHPLINDDLGGWVRLTTSRVAGLSGTVRLGARTHRLREAWKIENDGPPEVTTELPRGRLNPVDAELTGAPDSRSAKVKLTLDGETIEFDVWRALESAAEEAGNHSMALLAPNHDEPAPHGHGIGGFRLTQRGAARGSLRLADDTRFAFAAPLLEGGRLRIWQSLYRGTGSVGGLLKVQPAEAHRLQGSELIWFKREQTRRGRSYAGGFGPMTLQGRGGLYPQPERNQPITGLKTARLEFSEGAAPSPANRLNVSELTLPPRHPARAVITGDNPGSATLTVQTGAGRGFAAGLTGSFSGRLTLSDADPTAAGEPERRRVLNFRGMIIDDGSGPRGFGYFLLPQMPFAGPSPTTLRNSPILSGRVHLLPLP